MLPEQQGATCPAQLWPPRLGIKLLEGAPSTEKCLKCVFSRRITKNRCYQPSFCTAGGKGPKWSYQPCHPCNPFSSAWRSSGVSAPPRRPAPSSPSVSRWTSYRGCSPASRCERFTWSTSTAGREWASLSAREYERQRRKRGQPIRSLDTMCTVLLHTLLWSLSLFVGT